MMNQPNSSNNHQETVDTVDYDPQVSNGTAEVKTSKDRNVLMRLPDLTSSQSIHVAETIPADLTAEPLATEGVAAQSVTSTTVGVESSTANSAKKKSFLSQINLSQLPHPKVSLAILQNKWPLSRKWTMNLVGTLVGGPALMLAMMWGHSLLFHEAKPERELAEENWTVLEEPKQLAEAEQDAKPTIVMAMPGSGRPEVDQEVGNEPPTPTGLSEFDPYSTLTSNTDRSDRELTQQVVERKIIPPQVPAYPGAARFKGYIESVSPTVEARYEPYRPGLH